MKIVGKLKLLLLGVLNLQQEIIPDSHDTKNYCDGHAHHDFYCADKMSFVFSRIRQSRNIVWNPIIFNSNFGKELSKKAIPFLIINEFSIFYTSLIGWGQQSQFIRIYEFVKGSYQGPLCVTMMWLFSSLIKSRKTLESFLIFA